MCSSACVYALVSTVTPACATTLQDANSDMLQSCSDRLIPDTGSWVQRQCGRSGWRTVKSQGWCASLCWRFRTRYMPRTLSQPDTAADLQPLQLQAHLCNVCAGNSLRGSDLRKRAMKKDPLLGLQVICWLLRWHRRTSQQSVCM